MRAIKEIQLATTNVLFVCIGNSCRSQMAEAFANKFGEGRVRAWSAGVYPLGWIEANTRAVMEESGFNLDGQTSKGLTDVPLDRMDVVVKMGSEVFCDLPTFKGDVVLWKIPDPFGGDLDRHRLTRDMIELGVKDLLEGLKVDS